MTKIRFLSIASAGALLLSACGGSGDLGSEPPMETNDVPASATASWMAYTTYAQSLPASETNEPKSVSTIASVPTSETAEPVDIN